MALEGTEGFDHYSGFSDVLLRTGNFSWTNNGTTASIVTPGRGGYGKCLGVQASFDLTSSLRALFVSNLATRYVGFAVSSLPSLGVYGATIYVSMYDPLGGAVQCGVKLDFDNNAIVLYRGDPTDPTTLGTFSPAGLINGAFPFVEIMATVHPTAGAIAVQVNGQPVASATGVNTRATTNSSWGGISINPGDTTQAATWLIDDLRYNDTTAGPPPYVCDSWLGDLRVATLFPISNGTVAWTPLAGTNWQEVSETAFDGDATYNSTATNNAQDIFNLGSLQSVIDQVVAIQIVGAYREDAGGSHTLSQEIAVDGTIFPGATLTLASGYQFFADLFPVNPATSAAWTLSDVNALLAGYKALT